MKYLKISLKNIVGNRNTNISFFFLQIVLFTVLLSFIVLKSNLNGEIKNIALNPEIMRTIKYSLDDKTPDTKKSELIKYLSSLDNVEKVYETDIGINVVANNEDNSYKVRMKVFEKYDLKEKGLLKRFEYTKEYNLITKIIKILLILTMFIIIVIYSLNIYKQVLNRAKEYAIFKALGFKRSQIYRIVLYENAIITFFAVIFAYLISLGIVKLFISTILSIILDADSLPMIISLRSFYIIVPIILFILLIGADASNNAYKKVSTAELFKEE